MKHIINWVALRLFGATPFKQNVLILSSVHTVMPDKPGILYDVILEHKKRTGEIPVKVLRILQEKT